jgi:ferritin
MRFVKYLVESGGRVEIPAIPAPTAAFKSVEAAIALSVEWAKRVTGQINALVDLSIKESDHITQNMLNGFVHEQLEEVSMTENLLKVDRLAGNNRLYLEEYVVRHHAGMHPAAGRPLAKVAAA